jgi:hypothetical protein
MFYIGVLTALWLGVMTSISPCPLATNIAAVSFLARRVDRPRRALWACGAYTAGRVVAYTCVAGLVVWGVLSIPGASDTLQRVMNRLLGPVLVLAGMFLLGLLSFPGASPGAQAAQRYVQRGGLPAAGVLGLVFALSFCPVSAALFFGGLIPLAMKHESRILLPVLFGVGTSLPVLGFTLLIVTGGHALGRAFDRLTAAEKIMRTVAGVVFIGAGVYMSLRYVFGLLG